MDLDLYIGINGWWVRECRFTCNVRVSMQNTVIPPVLSVLFQLFEDGGESRGHEIDPHGEAHDRDRFD